MSILILFSSNCYGALPNLEHNHKVKAPIIKETTPYELECVTNIIALETDCEWHLMLALSEHIDSYIDYYKHITIYVYKMRPVNGLYKLKIMRYNKLLKKLVEQKKKEQHDIYLKEHK
jgi:hypothetical protein